MSVITIGLLWHNYPSENLGVGALSYSHIHVLEQIAEKNGVSVRYFIVGMMPQGSNRFDQVTKNEVEYFHFSLKEIAKKPLSFFQLVRKLATCKTCFDLSEGDSFTDIYGKKRFLQQSISKLAVIFAGRDLVLCPQTIGPFNTMWGKKISNWLLRRIKLVFARDNQSFEYLEDSGHSRNSKSTTDLAFALPYQRESFRFPSERMHVGINVSGLLLNGGYGTDGKLGLRLDYRKLTERLISTFMAMPNVQVHLIAHVISDRYEIEDDYRACITLAECFPDCIVAPKFSSPVMAKSYIANLDFFTGARMHATIAALSSGTAVVPIAYSRKFNGLFGTLNYNYLVDGKADDTQKAFDKLMQYFSERDKLRQKALVSAQAAEQRLQTYISSIDGFIQNV